MQVIRETAGMHSTVLSTVLILCVVNLLVIISIGSQFQSNPLFNSYS